MLHMYEVIKDAISAGGYKLADTQRKIKKLYFLGDLTEAQLDELLALASAGVSADAERPETLAMIQSLAERIAALEAEVKALKGGASEDQTEYPEWKPWDGSSKDYQKGAIVSHKDSLWLSTYEGQNVWEPDALGTENMWVLYDPTEAE